MRKWEFGVIVSTIKFIVGFTLFVYGIVVPEAIFITSGFLFLLGFSIVITFSLDAERRARIFLAKFCTTCGSRLHLEGDIYYYCEMCGAKVEPPVEVLK